MEMAYGLNITDPKDKFLRASVESLDLANRALTPGTFLVDTVPIRALQVASKGTVYRNLRFPSKVCP